MLARRRFDICMALCGVGAGSWYSDAAITLGDRPPASAIPSSNSDSSGNVSLQRKSKQSRRLYAPSPHILHSVEH